jgi:hypothetical protein
VASIPDPLAPDGTVSPPPHRPDYDVGERLREGWAGTLRAGTYRPTGRRVTVQDIRADLNATPGFVDRLAELGRRAAAVREPHLMAVYDLYDNGGAQLVAEWSAAPTLATLPPRSGLSAEQAVLAVDGVLAGLSALHGAGLVHGRVGAATVVLEDDGRARLAELAACAAADPDAVPATDVSDTARLGLDLLRRAGRRLEPVRDALESAVGNPRPDAAALRSAVSSAADAVFGAAWRERPAVAPTAARGRRGRWVVGLVVLAALTLVGGAIAGILLAAGHHANPAPSAPLAVGADASLTVTPGSGGCNTTFVFAAKGSLTGTGTLVYRWEQSDGQSSADTPLQIAADEGSFLLTQPWRFVGSQTVDGTMTLHILRPVDRVLHRSFHYQCP